MNNAINCCPPGGPGWPEQAVFGNPLHRAPLAMAARNAFDNLRPVDESQWTALIHAKKEHKLGRQGLWGIFQTPIEKAEAIFHRYLANPSPAALVGENDIVNYNTALSATTETTERARISLRLSQALALRHHSAPDIYEMVRTNNYRGLENEINLMQQIATQMSEVIETVRGELSEIYLGSLLFAAEAEGARGGASLHAINEQLRIFARQRNDGVHFDPVDYAQRESALLAEISRHVVLLKNQHPVPAEITLIGQLIDDLSLSYTLQATAFEVTGQILAAAYEMAGSPATRPRLINMEEMRNAESCFLHAYRNYTIALRAQQPRIAHIEDLRERKKNQLYAAFLDRQRSFTPPPGFMESFGNDNREIIGFNKQLAEVQGPLKGAKEARQVIYQYFQSLPFLSNDGLSLVNTFGGEHKNEPAYIPTPVAAPAPKARPDTPRPVMEPYTPPTRPVMEPYAPPKPVMELPYAPPKPVMEPIVTHPEAPRTLAFLQRVIANNPRDWKTHLEIAKMQRNEKHHSDAIAYLLRAVELAPRNADIYAEMGLNYRELGIYKDALHHFNLAIEINPALAGELAEQRSFCEALVNKG